MFLQAQSLLLPNYFKKRMLKMTIFRLGKSLGKSRTPKRETGRGQRFKGAWKSEHAATPSVEHLFSKLNFLTEFISIFRGIESGISISFLVSRSNLDRAPFSGFIDAINSERELGLENICYFSSPYLLPHLFWYSFLKNRKDCRADVVLSNSRRNLIPCSNRLEAELLR